MRCIIVLLVLVGLAQAIPDYDSVRQQWISYKAKYNKVYHNSVEDLQRLAIYLKNKAKILQHNQLFAEGKSTFYMAQNHFADMLPSEYDTVLPPLNATQMELDSTVYIEAKMPSLPSSVDWRQSGAVTGVKNQGACGSCWAFSATGAVEGRHYRSSRKLVSLSEQNLVDCSGAYGTLGCNGGWPHDAFRYIIANKGVDKENSYPYKANKGSCHFVRNDVGATLKSYVRVRQGSEQALAQAVAEQGPIAVAIDADHDSIRYYKGGVISESKCVTDKLTHAVLLVGYGHDSKYGDYWLIKNSWGTGYGENGYFKLARNKNNMCGIATVATYPVD